MYGETSGTGDAFVYAADPDNRFARLGDHLLVVSPNVLRLLQSNGAAICEEAVRMTSPQISVGARQAAVCDVGGAAPSTTPATSASPSRCRSRRGFFFDCSAAVPGALCLPSLAIEPLILVPEFCQVQPARGHRGPRQGPVAAFEDGRDTETRTTVRTIYYCYVTRSADLLELKVCANGFLYNMVRAITGTGRRVFTARGRRSQGMRESVRKLATYRSAWTPASARLLAGVLVLARFGL